MLPTLLDQRKKKEVTNIRTIEGGSERVSELSDEEEDGKKKKKRTLNEIN